MPLTQVDQGLLNSTAQYTGFKNRLINGQMQFNQRGITTLNPSNGAYSLDRWQCYQSISGKYTIQSSTTAPGGFTNSALITSSAATSMGATDYNLFQQTIEVANFADMQWGTASASPVTVSFWARCSLTGTFGGSLRTTNSTYNYPFTYTISTANTWEYKTITIPGPTSGSWGSTLNSGAVQVCWALGVGSTYSGTANAWTGAPNIFTATGATNILGTNGATFYITGVQLEKGSTATSFDYRPYGTELQLCQRYFVKYGGTSAYEHVGVLGSAYSASSVIYPIQLPVQMRATPSISGSGLAVSDGVNNTACTSYGLASSGQEASPLVVTGVFGTAGGLTQYRPYQVITNNSTSAYYNISAEL